MTHRPFAVTLLLCIALGSPGVARADDSASQTLPQRLVSVAARAYAGAELRWKAGAATADAVGQWSVRWLDAQRDLPLTGKALTAAVDEHLKRMQALEAGVKQQFNAGTATSLDADSAAFFRAQAELWSARAHGKE